MTISEMRELLEQRDIEDAIRHVDATPRLAGALHVERLLEEFCGGFRVFDDDGDVPQLGHGGFPFAVCSMMNGTVVKCNGVPRTRRSALAVS